MRRTFTALSLISLAIAIIKLVIAGLQHDFWSLTPVIAYNAPQGIFGWSLTLALIFFIISRFFNKHSRS
ncbi:hypothetical protein [Furfurilactobacillus siliginis]|uniref:Uncharacterized protein n=1 Tax=Furfurilactobacillus siliginis TaxID=348151 RepID=A0A0R2LGX6_9LACO|nr:hypothetical protein [Furfurilactobacillus siliginis]KRN97284.1 hypothetical protein IV55_GL000212 [Furfurilactobacillus siliginis]GEK28595.1 hypothetical protein LSI01_09060 [Furfurilactobacillus siliginis]